ncbi:AAA family ATPase [Kitasatospora sp. NBC_00240]|uniref:AAA family ATPase n=1 Tax=Kitasatospora sp. NBC_00240 TaxID=2903567 RepID=UPI002255A099|nr:AAA family ATPase [Kitasatospora sp. NBC_00240]MCX5215737.1 AAA family ATPase [Kitasatospora sp. NBC_00240]
MTGSQDTVLIVIRGNSGSGKSSIAAGVRARYGRGIAVVAQDNIRRTVLRERDTPGAANIGLINLVARHSLDHGYHVIVEGILAAAHYNAMLAALCADHRGRSHRYYLDVPYRETVRRHATRAQATEFSPEDMAGWYRHLDLLPDGAERIIPSESRLADSVQRILDDTALTPPGWRPIP